MGMCQAQADFRVGQGASDRGADTRVCRVETRLDAWRSEAGKFRRGCTAGKSVETSLDAADTSVRATMPASEHFKKYYE